jgi:hypothetical protein
MTTTPIVLAIFLLIAAPVKAQPAPREHYDDDTIYLSWPMIEYINRCVMSDQAGLEAAYPGTAKFASLLKTIVRPSGRQGSASYLELRFSVNLERVRFKMENDYETTIGKTNGWAASEIRAIAALCEAIIQQRVIIKEHKYDKDKLIKEWSFVKSVAANRLIPPREAAEAAQHFLVLLSDNSSSKALDQQTKKEVEAFEARYGAAGKLPFLGQGDSIKEAAVVKDFEDGFRRPLKSVAILPH